MDSKFSPEKEFPVPISQRSEIRAVLFREPNYAQTSTNNQTQPQTVPALLPVASVLPQPTSTQSPSYLPQQQVLLTQPQTSSSHTLAAAASSSTPSSSVPPTDVWLIYPGLNPPPQAVHAGYDIDDKRMYAGRVFHMGDYIPAKIFPITLTACATFNGAEIFKHSYEYIVGDKYMWVAGQAFPAGAVVVNPMSRNEKLYLGRCTFKGSLLCGKYVPSENCLYVPFGCKENRITGPFDILVHRDRYTNGTNN